MKSYILGAGPSILEVENLEEKTRDGVVIGINAAYALHSKIDYLIFQDLWFWQTKEEKLLSIKDTKLVTFAHHNSPKDKGIIFLNPANEDKITPCLPKSIKDPFFKCINTLGIALQFAVAIGSTEVNILGIDFRLEDIKKDYEHAHDEYPIERRKKMDSKRNALFIDACIFWINLIKDSKKHKIFNCSERSSLTKLIGFKHLLYRYFLTKMIVRV